HPRRARGRAGVVPDPVAGERLPSRAHGQQERAVRRRAGERADRRLRRPLAHGRRGAHHHVRGPPRPPPTPDRRADAAAALRDGRGAQCRVAHPRGPRIEPRRAEALREVRLPSSRRPSALLLRQQRRRADHVDRASSRSGGTRSAREAQGRAGPRRPLRILAIETSCDETGVAIVEDGRRIRSNVVASQLVHQDTGGIVPEVAAREHLRVLDALTEKALRDAGRDLTEIDAVAATVGPGLIGCLLVGANYGRGLALAAGLPFVGVNHLEGHVYANWLYETEDIPPEPELPAIVLVVSGAHSDLVLMEAHRRFRALGRTIDDAAGEAFDKVARLLHLGFPGGPAIVRIAKEGNPNAFPLPRALPADRFDFSFSGLKTAVLRLVRELEK